jgi:hypothetical protein
VCLLYRSPAVDKLIVAPSLLAKIVLEKALLTHNLQGLCIKAHWGKYGQYCSCLEVSEAFFSLLLCHVGNNCHGEKGSKRTGGEKVQRGILPATHSLNASSD